MFKIMMIIFINREEKLQNNDVLFLIVIYQKCDKKCSNGIELKQAFYRLNSKLIYVHTLGTLLSVPIALTFSFPVKKKYNDIKTWKLISFIQTITQWKVIPKHILYTVQYTMWVHSRIH